jgi:GNAT superfamily N-acetyltransferase
MQNLAESGAPTGLIGYLDEQPVAWCSMAPRAGFIGLANSRILEPVDEQPVWSITCLFIRKEYRRKGLSGRMIQAAADFARQHGATILEAYPVEPQSDKAPDVFMWTGTIAPFLQAGFSEVARRSEHRPILRLEL